MPTQTSHMWHDRTNEEEKRAALVNFISEPETWRM